MANPSTDGPTSALGTEILRRSHGNATGTGDVKLIDGTAGYIYTVLSVVVCERAGNPENFNLFVMADGSSGIFLLDSQPLAANSTFVFSDRIVITGADELTIDLDASGDVFAWCSYIEQRWV
jgi:hypothetical protein